METWIVIGIIVALVVYAVAIYNGLVALRNRVKNAFSQIDVQLQRRYDLIPNLVETAKGYMQHERDTLEAVIKARNAAQSAAQRAESNPSDPSTMKQLMGAEAALGGMLTRFFALAEAYPDLKANQNMAQLQEELASTKTASPSPARPTTTQSPHTTPSAKPSRTRWWPTTSASRKPNSGRSPKPPHAKR